MKEIMLEIFEKPNSIIAFCALIISVISVALTYQVSSQNRKHNQLSVSPLAYILPKDYEDIIAVVLQNKGTGPLISKQILFKHESGKTKKYLIDFMPNLKTGYFWSTFSKAQKIVLRPSEEKILLEFKGNISDQNFVKQRDKIRKALSKIEIKMEYTSIYNEKNFFELNYKLDWYNRHK